MKILKSAFRLMFALIPSGGFIVVRRFVFTYTAESFSFTMDTPKRSVTHCSQVRVRYADTDKMKIVYNGNYLVYFEIGRTELLRACGLPYLELEQAGYLLPVREVFARYKAPAVYDDLLDIYATYTLERSPTIRIEYLIKRGEEEIVSGYSTHPFVTAEGMKPVRPPKIFFDAMEATLAKQGL